MNKLLIAFFVISMMACKKDKGTAPVPNPNPNPTPTPVPIQTPPVKTVKIDFPTTVGSWWKYERIDTAETYLCYSGCPYIYPKDTIQEMITVLGNITMDAPGSSYDKKPATLLEIKNLSKNTTDSNYLFNDNTSIKIIDKVIQANLVFYEVVFSSQINVKDSGTTMPFPYQTPYRCVTDTVIKVGQLQFPHSIYLEQANLHWGSAAGEDITWETALNSSVGFLTMKKLDKYHDPSRHSAYYYYRKLLDYKIMP